MTYVALMFDEASFSTIASAAETISAKSALTLPAHQFHIKILENVGDASKGKQIMAAVKLASCSTPPLRGRFLRWELASGELRVLVECDELPRLQSSVKAQGLGRGAASPQSLHVTVGSVQGIDPQQHQAFLTAVEAAFPITNESQFLCTQLGFGPVHLPKGCQGLQLRGRSTDDPVPAAQMMMRVTTAKKARAQTQAPKAPVRNTGTPRWKKRAQGSTSAMEVDHRPARAVTIHKTRRQPSTHRSQNKTWHRH